MTARLSRLVLIVALAGAPAAPVGAQVADPTEESAAPAARARDAAGAGVAKALAGAVTGLAIHEAGHVLVGTLVGADFDLRKVDFQGVPFIAVSHGPGLSPREEYAVSSAGLWMQYGYSEWLLTTRGDRRSEWQPFEEGMLAFHVGVSLMYGVAGLARIGPAERDTRGLAGSLGISERWIGASVMAPGLLDAYRYVHPEARWAAWASRGLKVGLVGMTLVAGGQ